MGRRRGLSHHGRGTEFSHHGRETEFSRHGAGRETVRLRRAGMHPHFLFETSKRKCAVHGGKEKMFRAKRHFVPFLLVYGGPNKKLPSKLSVKALGAGPSLQNLSACAPRRTVCKFRGGCRMAPASLSALPASLSAAGPKPREGYPKGRGRSPSPLSRFKGARGKSKSPRVSLLGGRNSYAIMTPIVKNATVSMRKYRISFHTYFSHRS